jgi:hypothetical protein
MALSARVPDGPDLTALCRHKLEGIFDMHGVKTGSRADVPGFLEKLHGDRYFAMDFWALVESLEGVRDRISEEQIRRTVAECVCGWVPRGDPALAGIEESFDARAARRGESTPRAAEAPAEAGLRIVEQDEHNPNAMAEDAAGLDLATNFVERPVVELGASSATGSLGKIDQILSRLELNDHELKLLLESIESRISRLEPHVEELTSQVERTKRPVAATQTIPKYGRQKVDRARRLAAMNVTVGIWGTRMFRRMDSGLEKTGQRFAATDVAVKLWGSQTKRRMEPALARLTKAGARGRAAVASTASAAASGMMKSWAATLNWAERQGAMLTHIGTALGVVACLALVIWLWGQPRGYMARATPVAANSNAPAPAAATPAPAVPTAAAASKPDVQNAQEPAGQASSTEGASTAAEEVEPPVGTGSGVQRVAVKMNVEKVGYTAPPWIKWYSEDGKERATAAAALGAKAEAPVSVKSAAPAGEPGSSAKRQAR